MKGLRLYKKEKLCSLIAIQHLFARPGVRAANAGTASGCDTFSALVYPWRAVWAVNTRRHADCPQFLISVPKKRVRHAVDRVTQRRRCREAYRLQRHLLPSDLRVDIAFVYVGHGESDYQATQRAVARLLQRIGRSLRPDPLPDTTSSDEPLS